MVDLSLFSPVFLCFVASIFFLYIEQKTDCIVLYLPFFCFCQTSIYLDTAVLLLCSVFVPLVVYSVAFSLKCLIFSTLRLFSSFVIQDENMFHRTLGIVYFYKAIRSSPTSVNGILTIGGGALLLVFFLSPLPSSPDFGFYFNIYSM